MSKRPSSVDLLETARELLLSEVLPAVPEDKRYATRMVANAIAIACRELDGASGALAAELASLENLYAQNGEPGAKGRDAPPAQCDALNARLAAGIRAGTLDTALGVHAHLLEQVRARLRATNPKYLDAAGEA